MRLKINLKSRIRGKSRQTLGKKTAYLILSSFPLPSSNINSAGTMNRQCVGISVIDKASSSCRRRALPQQAKSDWPVDRLRRGHNHIIILFECVHPLFVRASSTYQTRIYKTIIIYLYYIYFYLYHSK